VLCTFKVYSVTEVRAQYALMYAQYAGSCACVRLHDSHSAKQYATCLQCCSPNLTHSTQRTDTVAHNAQVTASYWSMLLYDAASKADCKAVRCCTSAHMIVLYCGTSQWLRACTHARIGHSYTTELQQQRVVK
jgi:hypothetical protein